MKRTIDLEAARVATEKMKAALANPDLDLDRTARYLDGQLLEGPTMAASRLKPDRDTVLISVRFPLALTARIDERVAELQKDQPGVTFSRADVIRTATIHELDRLAANKGEVKP